MIIEEQLARHSYFKPWRDPLTGLTSYLLDERVAPLQKSFYFVNTSYHNDGPWLWFEYAHPPAPFKSLAAVCLNPDKPTLRTFPHTTIGVETPMLLPDGSMLLAMAASSPDIYHLDLDGNIERFASIPETYVRNRRIDRTGTHFTLTADGRSILIDGKVGNVWYVALIDKETRAFHLIKEFTRNYNHGQCSPINPSLFSIAQDHWKDPYTGQAFDYDNRIWLMTTDGERCEPVEPGYYHSPGNRGNQVCHEFWAEDGTLCWIRYKEGAYEMNPATKSIIPVWKRPLCHAHCTRDRRLWVADQSPYLWPQPCSVLLFDRVSGTETAIVSGMPEPITKRMPYHCDPHPRFIANDSCIVYTTTVHGRVDVALYPVAP